MLGVVVTALGMVAPYVSKLLIDQAYPARDISLLHVLVGTLVIVGAIATGLGALSSFFTQYINARLSQATGLLLFNHLQHLPTRFFDRGRTGEVMSRFADVRSALGTVSQVIHTVFFQSIYLVLVPPFLFWLDWRLAVVAMITLPLSTVFVGVTGRRLRLKWKQSAEAQADLSAFQVEILSNIRQFKVMGLEREIFLRAQSETHRALGAQLRAMRTGTVVDGSTSLLQVLSTSLIALVGWRFVLAGEMTLGTYIAFTAYLGYVTAPLMRIAQLFSAFQQSAVQLARLFEYLDELPEQDPAAAYVQPIGELLSASPELVLKGVRFAYASEQWILRDVDAVFEAGKVTAIMGPSGAGKSTLLRLLTRIEQPSGGQVLCDGRPASMIPLGSYRRSLAVVWQEVGLLRGTLWLNLTIGRSDTTREMVDDAVYACGLADLLEALPAGYDTPIAEWGASLSGGQRQRIALARALIRATPLVVLDEATSNLDALTEEVVLKEVMARLRGRTVIFVSHRATPARLADRIHVLDDGHIRATGTHDALLRQDPFYRQLNGVGRDPEQAAVAHSPALRTLP